MAAAINEIKVVGRAFRKLIDQSSNKWMRESFWTVASDVEFDDGETAQKKVTDINNRLGGLSFFEDENGKKWVVGADAVPKKLGSLDKIIKYLTEQGCIPKSDDEEDVLVAIQEMIDAIIQKLKDAGLLESDDNDLKLEDLLNAISRIKSVPIYASYHIANDNNGGQYAYLYLNVNGNSNFAVGNGSVGTDIKTKTRNIKMIV